MSSIHIRSQISYNDLLKAVEQLDSSDLEKFVSEVISLRAQRKGKNVPQKEAELLLKINQKIDPKVQKEYDDLVAKKQSESLTSKEHKRLLKLTDEIEKLEARRAKYLSKLADIRHTSLSALVQELGIQKPVHG